VAGLGDFREPKLAATGQYTGEGGWVTAAPPTGTDWSVAWCGWEIDLSTLLTDIDQPLLVEAYFPDTDARSNMIFLYSPEEDVPANYTTHKYIRPAEVSGETGLHFRISGKQVVGRNIYRPVSKDLRIILAGPHGDYPARCSKVVVSRITNLYNLTNTNLLPIPDWSPAGKEVRDVAFNYEEGGTWASLYGASPSLDPEAHRFTICDSYFNRLAFGGYSYVHAGAVAYGTMEYPSVFRDFGLYTIPDTTVYYALMGERYGLRVGLEVSPWLFNDIVAADLSNVDDVAAFHALGNGDVFMETPHGIFDHGGSVFSPTWCPAHPTPVEKFAAVCAEVAQRYSGYPAVKDILLNARGWRENGHWHWGSHRYGYGDYAMQRMEAETTIQLPTSYQFTHVLTPYNTDISVGSTSSERYLGRYHYLWSLPEFQDWRKNVVRQNLQAIVAAVRAVAPDMNVKIINADPTVNAAAGIDYDYIKDIEGLSIAGFATLYGRRKGTYIDWQQAQETINSLQDLRRFASTDGTPTGLFRGFAYLEGPYFLTKANMNVSSGANSPNVTSAMQPVEHSAMRDFVRMMAAGNITFLMADGGDKVVSPDWTTFQDFVRAYTAVPADVPLVPHGSEDVEPLMVQLGSNAEGVWVRAINIERYPVQYAITMTAEGIDILAGETDGPHLGGHLPPYTSKVWRFPTGTTIQSVSSAVPTEEETLFRSLVNAMREIGRTAAVGTMDPGAFRSHLMVLRETANEAESLWDNGNRWQAQQRLERWDVLQALEDLEQSLEGLLTQTTPAKRNFPNRRASEIPYGIDTLYSRLTQILEFHTGRKAS
jgi:hypothetical protein